MTTYRIMAVQEEGSEICLGSGLPQEEAYRKLPILREDYPEFRDFWVEQERNYYQESAEEYWNESAEEYWNEEF